jgi:hypothetical protein
MVLGVLTSISYVTVLGMAILAAVAGATAGFLYRTYMHQRVPFYAPIIVGLGAIGLWLNGSAALIAVASGITDATGEPVVITQIETNVLAAIVGLFTAYGGGLFGDALAPNVSALMGAQTVDRKVSTIVRSIGRVTTITVPETIADIDGYEPVSAETKATLAGNDFVFPRGLTVAEITDRIATRAREDYGIAHVDVELGVDGSVEHFGVGGRVAGIGPTLPPRKVAMGIKANPPPKASPGDKVVLWDVPTPEADSGAEVGTPAETDGEADAVAPAETDGDDDATAPAGAGLPPIFGQHPDRWYRPQSERYAFAVRTPEGDRRYAETADRAGTLLARFYEDADGSAGETDGIQADVDAVEETRPPPERVAMGELRATNGDVATVTLDVGRVDGIDQSTAYRLTTLQAVKNPERVFASLLRTANETLGSVDVVRDGGLDGQPIGALATTVLAVRTTDRRIETIPPRTYRLQAGEVLFAVGPPNELRKVEELNETRRR